MTTRTHSRTRPVSAPPYYQGRPAVFWLAVFAPPSRRPAPGTIT